MNDTHIFVNSVDMDVDRGTESSNGMADHVDPPSGPGNHLPSEVKPLTLIYHSHILLSTQWTWMRGRMTKLTLMIVVLIMSVHKVTQTIQVSHVMPEFSISNKLYSLQLSGC
jgi:hypothetical protein